MTSYRAWSEKECYTFTDEKHQPVPSPERSVVPHSSGHSSKAKKTLLSVTNRISRTKRTENVDILVDINALVISIQLHSDCDYGRQINDATPTSVEHSSEGLHQESQETPTSDLGALQNLSPWAIAPSSVL
ncbi:unnamed protein product [Spodoptera exigua]|nr:unnamed protein product [Spodoptera exigua]